MLIEERDSGADLAGSAVTALEAVVFEEGGLNRMECLVMSEAVMALPMSYKCTSARSAGGCERREPIQAAIVRSTRPKGRPSTR